MRFGLAIALAREGLGGQGWSGEEHGEEARGRLCEHAVGVVCTRILVLPAQRHRLWSLLDTLEGSRRPTFMI